MSHGARTKRIRAGGKQFLSKPRKKKRKRVQTKSARTPSRRRTTPTARQIEMSKKILAAGGKISFEGETDQAGIQKATAAQTPTRTGSQTVPTPIATRVPDTREITGTVPTQTPEQLGAERRGDFGASLLAVAETIPGLGGVATGGTFITKVGILKTEAAAAAGNKDAIKIINELNKRGAEAISALEKAKSVAAAAGKAPKAGYVVTKAATMTNTERSKFTSSGIARVFEAKAVRTEFSSYSSEASAKAARALVTAPTKFPMNTKTWALMKSIIESMNQNKARWIAGAIISTAVSIPISTQMTYNIKDDSMQGIRFAIINANDDGDEIEVARLEEMAEELGESYDDAVNYIPGVGFIKQAWKNKDITLSIIKGVVARSGQPSADEIKFEQRRTEAEERDRLEEEKFEQRRQESETRKEEESAQFDLRIKEAEERERERNAKFDRRIREAERRDKEKRAYYELLDEQQKAEDEANQKKWDEINKRILEANKRYEDQQPSNLNFGLFR